VLVCPAGSILRARWLKPPRQAAEEAKRDYDDQMQHRDVAQLG
jgi:hypothetical protein